MLPARELSLVLVAALMAATLGVCSALNDNSAPGGAAGSGGFKEASPANEELQLEGLGPRTGPRSGIRADSRLLTVPNSLARFFLRPRGPSEHQMAQAAAAAYAPEISANGYKRSSSQLDALNGVTLGKRSAPVEFVNYEPVFGRQSFLRVPSRVYDMRWAPVDSIEGPSQTSDY